MSGLRAGGRLRGLLQKQGHERRRRAEAGDQNTGRRLK